MRMTTEHAKALSMASHTACMRSAHHLSLAIPTLPNFSFQSGSDLDALYCMPLS